VTTALWVVAVLAGLLGLHRLAMWAERRGWIYYRDRRGSSGTLSSAFLEVQSLLEPSQRHVLEETRRDEAVDDEAGEPPAG